eukprot:1158477-Pelagomonas_calceolata.AAC.4
MLSWAKTKAQRSTCTSCQEPPGKIEHRSKERLKRDTGLQGPTAVSNAWRSLLRPLEVVSRKCAFYRMP